jgi:catechol 2,3-dioxygenase-like lactoylglutathione lyase family enzyme
MEARAIDHLNLAIPADGVADALDFYRDSLGFGVEDLDRYRQGERSIFTFRLGDTSVIHVSPMEDFQPPSKRNFVHACIVLEASIDEIHSLTECENILVERESNPLGATGRNPAMYITDPFGYTLELKEAM